jgi:hypothetical protein
VRRKACGSFTVLAEETPMIDSRTAFDLPTADGTVYVEFAPRLDVGQVELLQTTIQSIRNRQEMVEMLRLFAEQEDLEVEINLDRRSSLVSLQSQPRMPHRREIAPQLVGIVLM